MTASKGTSPKSTNVKKSPIVQLKLCETLRYALKLPHQAIMPSHVRLIFSWVDAYDILLHAICVREVQNLGRLGSPKI